MESHKARDPEEKKEADKAKKTLFASVRLRGMKNKHSALWSSCL